MKLSRSLDIRERAKKRAWGPLDYPPSYFLRRYRTGLVSTDAEIIRAPSLINARLLRGWQI